MFGFPKSMKNQDFAAILGSAVYNLNEQKPNEAKAHNVKIDIVKIKLISEPDTYMEFSVSNPHLLLEVYQYSLKLTISLKPYGDITLQVQPGYMEREGSKNMFKFTSRNSATIELSF